MGSAVGSILSGASAKATTMGAKLLPWWRGLSGYRQLAYGSAAAYGGILLTTRLGRALVSRRGILSDYPPPGHINHIYRHTKSAQYSPGSVPTRDDQYSDFGSPLNHDRVLSRGEDNMDRRSISMIPTHGLVQQNNRDRRKHTLQDQAKYRDQMSRLFNIGG